MPPGATGSAWKPMVSGRACPAAATPMTTPLRRTSSAALSVSWSTSSTILQGQLRMTMSLPISKPFTTPSVLIPPLAGVRLQVLRLNLPLPPPDYRLPYLCVFIQLFPPVLCPFLGEGLSPGNRHRIGVIHRLLQFLNQTARQTRIIIFLSIGDNQIFLFWIEPKPAFRFLHQLLCLLAGSHYHRFRWFKLMQPILFFRHWYPPPLF